jgi:hypothetical protein
MAIVTPLHKLFLPKPEQEIERKERSDKKHRFTFRTHEDVWDKISKISLLAGGASNCASLNLVMNMLVQYALQDEYIMRRIQSELPQLEGIISVRDWRA